MNFFVFKSMISTNRNIVYTTISKKIFQNQIITKKLFHFNKYLEKMSNVFRWTLRFLQS